MQDVQEGFMVKKRPFVNPLHCGIVLILSQRMSAAGVRYISTDRFASHKWDTKLEYWHNLRDLRKRGQHIQKTKERGRWITSMMQLKKFSREFRSRAGPGILFCARRAFCWLCTW